MAVPALHQVSYGWCRSVWVFVGITLFKFFVFILKDSWRTLHVVACGGVLACYDPKVTPPSFVNSYSFDANYWIFFSRLQPHQFTLFRLHLRPYTLSPTSKLRKRSTPFLSNQKSHPQLPPLQLTTLHQIPEHLIRLLDLLSSSQIPVPKPITAVLQRLHGWVYLRGFSLRHRIQKWRIGWIVWSNVAGMLAIIAPWIQVNIRLGRMKQKKITSCYSSYRQIT